jgi:hypothetical protein
MMQALRVKKIFLNKARIFLLTVIFSFVFLIGIVNAANFSFGIPSKVGVDQDFQVDILLDTQMENINAVEGKILYDKNILTLKEVRDSNNVITLWVKDPAQNKNTGIIEFSGITPGGFNSFTQKKSIFSLVFSAKIAGETRLKTDEVTVLLNDGKGSPAKITIVTIPKIKIDKDIVSSQPILAIQDKESPEPLFVEIIKDKSIANGQWVAVFYGHDKKSGIDRYEFAEQKGGQVLDYKKLSWQPAQSPQLLSDQKRASFVYIKAVDRAGNEIVAVVHPLDGKKLYENFWFWCIIIISLLLLFGGTLWRKQKRSSRY